MIISDKHRFVYIGPPKTASTSLHRFFEQEEWSGDTSWINGEQHRTMIPKRCADYFTWSVSRNAYRRLVSLWVMSQRHNQREKKHTPQLDTFQDFLNWIGTRPFKFYHLSQYEWFNTEVWANKDDSVLVGIPDMVLKFEELPGCLELLPFVNAPCDIEDMNKTHSERVELTQEEIIAAADFVERDCQEFGYEFLGR